jgi:hypothetical protein
VLDFSRDTFNTSSIENHDLLLLALWKLALLFVRLYVHGSSALQRKIQHKHAN